MYGDVELRKLPAGFLYDVINTLETNNDWKIVMSYIPKNPDSTIFEQKYCNKDIRLIENYSKASNRQCAEILIDEWGTSGKVRPTLSTLKEIVIKANILKAADQIATLLQEERAPRPSDGPGADIDTDVTNILENEDINQRFNSFDPTKRIQNDSYNDKKQCNISTVPMKSKTQNGEISFNIPQMECFQTLNVSADSTQWAKTSRNIPNFDIILQGSQQLSNRSTRIATSTTESEVETSQAFVEQVLNHSKSENNSYQKSLPNISDLHRHIDKEILEDTKLINFEYKELETITCKFSETIVAGPYGPGGKIGSGGFGEVFIGCHPTYEKPLAVKKIREHLLWSIDKPHITIDMFNTEVKNLTQFRHKNIVPILGFSTNGPVPCIICEYIDGGSLEKQLAAKVLTKRQRIDIMIGTAEGLKYLHTSSEQILPNNGTPGATEARNVTRKYNFVHRDVKSANILLTKECVPKICDFGLAKHCDRTYVTTSPVGTRAYLAPEGFSGTITQKGDIYSYGVVLLELLTGLKPIIVDDNNTINIRDYVQEHVKEKGEIVGILDPIVGKWTNAEKIYALSLSCLQYERSNRPSIENICDILSTINNE